VNDKGNGQGEHTETCTLEVLYKCLCGHIFNGSYAEVKTALINHLIKVCLKIMCPATRKLMRVVNRFEELGVPQKLIEFYRA
jgi:hypothetical protein